MSAHRARRPVSAPFENAVPAPPMLQRACACGGSAGASGQCSNCETRDTFGVPSIQPKLAVSAPDDPHEREADRVADRVMRMPAPMGAAGSAAPAGFAAALGAGAGGAPLQPAARSFFEPRFQRDLGHVRVHDGASAAAMAHAIDARAFTHGANIYFSAGQYDPGSQAGRRLLAHELTHVFQQKSDPRCIRRQPAPSRGLEYDRTALSLPALPEDLDFDTARGLLRKALHERKLRSGMMKGAKSDSDLIAMMWVLVTLAGREKWGYEIDLVAPLAPDPAPMARITVRIDWSGNALAELVSSGRVDPPGRAKTAAAAKTLLVQNYGIGEIKEPATPDQSRQPAPNPNAAKEPPKKDEIPLVLQNWKRADLNMILGAFAIVPTRDLPALKGLSLARVGQLPGDPSLAGQHSASGDKGALTFDDDAFAPVSNFVGSKGRERPYAYLPILHEVGHAVEVGALRDAFRLRNEKRDIRKEAIDRRDRAEDARNKVKEKQGKGASKQDRAGLKAAEETLAARQKEVDAAIQDYAASEEALQLAGGYDGKSARLRAFENLVKGNNKAKEKIEPFTDYGREGVAEFFAETYALFVADPQYLKDNRPMLFEWFKEGSYK